MDSDIAKPHLSPTQIGMLLRCPRQWYYRYALGLKSPPSGAMAQSRAWHQAVEHGYKHKLQIGELPDEDATVEVFADRFDAEFDPDGSEPPVLDPGEKVGSLKDQGVEITRVHRRYLAPQAVPRLVEHRFSVSLGESFPFVLEGIWDLVEQNGAIVDNKAKGRAPSDGDMASDVQLTSYSLAYRLLEGRREPALRLDCVIKTKTPRAARLVTARTDGEVRWFLGLVEEVARMVIAGIFPPNPTGWWCSEKFCGYWDRCRGGAAKEGG
jgi:RecB family exonuclease